MATKKLTKAQLAVIAGCSIGDKLWSDPLTNSQQRSIDAMLNHGHLKITGGGYTMVEYTIQDTPEVRAAIAQPTAAPTVNAEPWTPAVGQLVRFKEGVILYGDNHDVDDLQARRVVGKITRMDDGIAVDFGLDGSYVCFADELEPAASADAVNAADVGGLRVGDCVTWQPASSPGDLEIGTVRAIDGDQIDVEFDNADDDGSDWVWASDLKLIPSDDPRDAQIAALTRDLAAAKAEAAALERELEAVKQMFDGYQSAALDTERQQTATINRLTQACDKLQAERDALKRFYDMACMLDLNSDMQDLASADQRDFYLDYLQMIADLDNLDIKWGHDPADAALATVAAERAAADTGMVAALKAHDNGRRTSADNVLAMFADDDEGTIA